MSDVQPSAFRRLGDIASLWRPLVSRTCEFWAIIHKHWPLVRELAIRDIKVGHVGHGLGSVWVFVQPLVVVVTFMLIFGVVIGTKIVQSTTFPGDYTSYILIGIVPWLITANALGRAPNVFIGNASLVKQVIFPIETLPVASTIACVITFLPCIFVVVVYKLFAGGVPLIAFLLPIVLAMHVLLVVGLVLVLSVLTPFLRDIRELVTIYLSVSMYATPAIYLPDWIPALLRPVLFLNPFSYVVWVYQDVLFFGRIDHGFAWIVFALMSSFFFLAGLVVFRKARLALGNVI